jgi:hypothetical protein
MNKTTDYNEFLETKRKSFLESGFEINESELNCKSISIELKESYFKINQSNHKSFAQEKKSVLTLFN